jgi:antibiotic biosynthesis monooxygenase (ABM) superfamily enzyme
MFVTVFSYRAKAGQEEAVIALHEEWEQDRLPKTKGYISGELLSDIRDPRSFMTIARFENAEVARAAAAAPEQDAWYRRLVNLTEQEPVFTDCDLEWRVH